MTKGRRFRAGRWTVLAAGLLFAGPLWTVASGRVQISGDWRTAGHSPSGLAPDPAIEKEAIVQVFAARTYSWRGAFSVHTWLAAKPRDASDYTRYEVIGWRMRMGQPVVSISTTNAPDAEWFGARPTLLRDVRGADADAVIARLPQAVADYPFPDRYTLWPGPNSNTFTAYIGRAIPELRLTMPSNAVGKDYLPLGDVIARAPSGTGYQISLLGVFGATAAVDEGIELNVLGLAFGLDLRHPALKLPGIGRVPE